MPRLSKLIILILIYISFSFFSCTNNNSESDKINISVTLPPFADFVKQIVGDKAYIHTLIPPGTNAHTFEPNPISIKSLIESDIFFRVGDIFNMEQIIFRKIDNSILNKIVDCSKNINIINNDPHYWISPENVKIITEIIVNELSNNFPQHENYFRSNRNKFISKVDSIDNDISNKLSDKKNRTLFVYHPAWQYLANRYNLKQIAIEKSGKSPKAKDLQEFIEQAKSKNADCIFFDPHFNFNSVSTVAKSVNLEIDSLNPLPENYIENLIIIGEKLEKHLR